MRCSELEVGNLYVIKWQFPKVTEVQPVKRRLTRGKQALPKFTCGRQVRVVEVHERGMVTVEYVTRLMHEPHDPTQRRRRLHCRMILRPTTPIPADQKPLVRPGDRPPADPQHHRAWKQKALESTSKPKFTKPKKGKK